MIRCLVLLLLLGMASASPAQTCEQLGSEIVSPMRLSIAADQMGPIDTMRRVGLQGIRQCPNSEQLWYAAVRSVELIGMPLGYTGSDTLQSLVTEAVKHEPTSARIATVSARVTLNVDQARHAVALDPKYPPARRALALALAHAGQVQEALRLCPLAHPTKEDELTRARILLDAGRPSEALPVARKAVASNNLELKEVVPAQLLDREANELLGFTLLKAGRTLEATRVFRIAAAQGSIAAKQQLDSLKPHP